ATEFQNKYILSQNHRQVNYHILLRQWSLLEEGLAFSQTLIHQGISSLGSLRLWEQRVFTLAYALPVKCGQRVILGAESLALRII
ncbi:MAG: hypothetical protein IJF16_02415, partial [Clostridia bacterium]|nr:hypothetical protein [Clostridia bacterium]